MVAGEVDVHVAALVVQLIQNLKAQTDRLLPLLRSSYRKQGLP